MNDQLERLFADLRAAEIGEMRAPGVAAARQTVRRRRAGTMVAAACAVVIAAGGAFAVLDRPASTAPAPAAPSVSPSVSEADRNATVASDALTDDDVIASFDVRSPVTAGYRREERVYAPYLEVSVACAGTGGQITLQVDGRMPEDVKHVERSRELARVTVPCGTEPVRKTAKVQSTVETLLTLRLAATTGAAGAGFAYRLYSREDTRLAPTDPSGDPWSVLPAVGSKPRAGTLVREGGSTMEMPRSDELSLSGGGHLRDGRKYTLMLACRGDGTLRFQLREGGEVVADHTIPCGVRPKAYEFPIDHEFANRRLTEELDQYRSDSPARAARAYVLIEE
ncbi:hypothetical protein [Actinoplanes sp. NPDC051851]|uniref:hypothetical protein n=1 Tax=Actinoplanes sp. NPDC051851 TaxID=3154753 RepID=UPI003441A413